MFGKNSLFISVYLEVIIENKIIIHNLHFCLNKAKSQMESTGNKEKSSHHVDESKYNVLIRFTTEKYIEKILNEETGLRSKK